MGEREVQRVDAAEIVGVEHVLGADAAGRARAEIGLEGGKHRVEHRDARNAEAAAALLQHGGERHVDQRVEHDAGRVLDLPQRPVDLRLRADQRVDVLDRMRVLVLRRGGARDVDQRLAGRVGDQVQMEIAMRRHALESCGRRRRDHARQCLMGPDIPLVQERSTARRLVDGSTRPTPPTVQKSSLIHSQTARELRPCKCLAILYRNLVFACRLSPALHKGRRAFVAGGSRLWRGRNPPNPPPNRRNSSIKRFLRKVNGT